MPLLDRPGIDESTLTPDQAAWRRDGVVIKRGFIAPEILDPYIRRRLQLQEISMHRHALGWDLPSPYQHVPELRAVCLYPPLMRLMEELIGEPMMLHLNLTGWISTERNWHQDDYLNPGHVNSWYTAVWIALGTIEENVGPFEYIPGSHRWPLTRQDKVKAWMSPEERARVDPDFGYPTWPKDSERFVVPAIEAEIAAQGSKPERFLAEMGDVLVWHGRLMHRGSKATGGYWRPALIAHYSGVNHRDDMANRATDENGFTYALFEWPLA